MNRYCSWLPEGKSACVLVSIDDFAPSTQAQGSDFGGDGPTGQLRYLDRLLTEVPWLRPVGFIIPNLTFTGHTPRRKWLTYFPKKYQERIWGTKPTQEGTYDIRKYSAFIQELNIRAQRIEWGQHGLTHSAKGLLPGHEFQNSMSKKEVEQRVLQGGLILSQAGVRWTKGFCPPYFSTPQKLVDVLRENEYSYLMSSRDLFNDVKPDETSQMSGLRGVPAFRPASLGGGLVHIPTNFQATSTPDRAKKIIDMGGLLSVKIHVSKHTFGHTALDGLDDLYVNYLIMLFHELDRSYGTHLWWPSASEVANQYRINTKLVK